MIAFLPHCLCSQSITVLDRDTHEPIENVRIIYKLSQKPIIEYDDKGIPRPQMRLLSIDEIATGEDGRVSTTRLQEKDSILFYHPNYLRITLQFGDILLQNGRVYLNERPITMPEITITPHRNSAFLRQIPYQTLTLDRSFLQFQNPQNMADALTQSGQVWVQKSQQGGGSPVLRGFEANKILLVVDGIRMNNAIYRGGHLQSIITVDNLALDKVEVVYGPGSVPYGSDALGGVIQMRTRQPRLATGATNNFSLNALTRYATANQEKTLHLDMNVGGKKLASWSSFTFSDFGDLQTGNIREEKYPHFGQRPEYVQRIEGKDVVVKNENPNLQVASGYKQYDFIQKVLFQPSSRFRQTLNLQLSTTTDVPRYDRLTEYRNGKLRYAEWYYGPQTRFLAALQTEWRPAACALFDQLNFTLAYQQVQESRFTRNLNNPTRGGREEKVHFYTFNIDARKSLGLRHTLQYGGEWAYNRVLSTASNLNIETNEQKPLDTRYPDGGSDMHLGGLYLTHRWALVTDKLFLEEGVRLSYSNLNSVFKDKTFFPFLQNEVTQTNVALNGNVGLTWTPTPGFKIGGVLSSGFRAPNVDDLAKVFESTPGNVVIPNPNLKPEYTYNAELNLEKRFGQNVIVSANVFYSQFRDVIQTGKAQFNGQDSILYNGVNSGVQMNLNIGKAYLYGTVSKIEINIAKYAYISQTIGYTYGRDFDDVPLDHIAPLFGRSAIGYKRGSGQIEAYALFNGWKKKADMRPVGEDNAIYGTPEGYPAWFTLNLKTSWQFSPHGSVQLGLENILDVHYRYFASGVSAAGRNFFIALRGNF